VGEAIGAMLPLAVALAIGPMPIVATVVMLVGAQARTTVPAYVLAWVAGVALVGAVVLLIAGPSGASDHGEPATWLSVGKLAIGVALGYFAVRQWSGRPVGDDEVPTPGWMATIDGLTPVKAAGLGLAFSIINPKNVLFGVGAAATDAQTGISAGRQALVWAIFTVIASAGVVSPVIVYLAVGERAPQLLDRMKVWMIRNNSVVMAVLFVIVGAVLIGDAISGFSTS
jgi:hypothetical protein